MSTQLSEETKSVTIITEGRTNKLEILTEKDTEYKIRIHHEEVEVIDGLPKKAIKKPAINITVNALLTSDETITYLDDNGIEKTVPTKDIPAIVTKWADLRRGEAKAEELAQE